ncbi:MAG: hypothetical protein H6Q30_1297 [Bacteroidetes bacterium]|jgi:hypothetical protein|nr:hypothetical protein [Bacteroidota bacterium]
MWPVVAALVLVPVTLLVFLVTPSDDHRPVVATPQSPLEGPDSWIDRARAVTALFHEVYTPCWEGAYGAIGDAYLFRAARDSSLLQFHLVDHDLRQMCEGTWVDDRAWVCLAELEWWAATGKRDLGLVMDAIRRYNEARRQGRLSSHEGFWSWYNWPPGSGVNERIFTNSNMNQMATVACKLYDATGDRRFLKDALLTWNGEGKVPGIEKRWYRGDGKWEGRLGRAAFGKELPWDGAGYCAVASALFRSTSDEKYRRIAIATARRVMDPASGWVDPEDFYQLRMDGNGAFVNFLLDAYALAPDQLPDLLRKVETMLTHVWTNNHGRAGLTLHRESDHGIRNGWNPFGGEDGYKVNEVGTVHAQGEAARAFGTFVYYFNQR